MRDMQQRSTLINCHSLVEAMAAQGCTSLGRASVGSKLEEHAVGVRLVEQAGQLRLGIRFTIADARSDEVESALSGVFGFLRHGKAHVDEGKDYDQAGVNGGAGDMSQRQRHAEAHLSSLQFPANPGLS